MDILSQCIRICLPFRRCPHVAMAITTAYSSLQCMLIDLVLLSNDTVNHYPWKNPATAISLASVKSCTSTFVHHPSAGHTGLLVVLLLV